ELGLVRKQAALGIDEELAQEISAAARLQGARSSERDEDPRPGLRPERVEKSVVVRQSVFPQLEPAPQRRAFPAQIERGGGGRRARGKIKPLFLLRPLPLPKAQVPVRASGAEKCDARRQPLRAVWPRRRGLRRDDGRVVGRVGPVQSKQWDARIESVDLLA